MPVFTSRGKRSTMLRNPLSMSEPMNGGQSFPTFEPEIATTALVESFAVPPTDKRLRTINRCMKRLVDAGIMDKTVAMYMIGANEDASFKNWKSPGTFDLIKNGTPTFIADDGWQANVQGDFLNTQLPVDNLDQNDCEFHFWSKTATGQSNTDLGAVNSGLVGLSIVARNTNNFSTGRLKSGTGTINGIGFQDNVGMFGIRRLNATTVAGFGAGLQLDAGRASTSSAASVPQTIYLLVVNNNGTAGASFSGRQQSMHWFGQRLTDAQSRELAGAVGEYLEYLQYGEVDLHDAGSGTATVNADVVFYGTTPGSIAGAVAVVRAGGTAVICGGWRDRLFGGMSAGGLGYSDFVNMAGLGGLPRWVVTKMNEYKGVPDTSSVFEPRYFRWVMLELLETYNIPVYWSDGIDTVQKTGGRITSFTTVDGRTFTGNQFHDGSYEGDLVIKHGGISYDIGREVAGASAEGLNGYRGVLTSDDGALQQFKNPSTGAVVHPDPWIIPGDTGSGLVAGLQGIYSEFTPALHDQPALGTADAKLQAYNFRLTMTTASGRKVPLPIIPPPGYTKARYELLLRYLNSHPTAAIANIAFPRFVSSNVMDFNAKGGQSSDLFGENHDYSTATYAQREVIWKDHWNYILGWWYLLQHDTSEPRVPSALRTEALTWGWVRDHYYNRHENDVVYEMPQLYVRETIRMSGLAKLNANHLIATDGTAPALGTNTIATASYPLDSHSVQRLAYEFAAGSWGVWQEGNFFSGMGGTDQIAPIPIEICLPTAAECPNISTSFCVSATHAAFGSYRMEFTAMMAGYSLGWAAALQGVGNIQNVDYPTLRTALLASPELTSEVAPVLPQVN